MDLCYSETLKMPAVYTQIKDDEMYYLAGGGTVRVKASAKTVKQISKAGVSVVGGIIGAAFGGIVGAEAVSAGLANVIYTAILNISGYEYKPLDAKFSNPVFPDATLNLDLFV